MAAMCFASIPRKFVNGIAADLASVQMMIDLQLPVQIQPFVDELHQPVKTAFAHIALSTPVAQVVSAALCS
jgi:hypothetical protein